jgi:hypothetical protein
MKKRYNTDARARERYIYQLKRRFDMTPTDYVVMGKTQDWRCVICQRSRDELQQDLVVDHDHTTGQVRGLLCKACNQALGLLQDDVVRVGRVLSYLSR